ncbi:hypothetical protein EFK50_13640 [Nocardioides marmoriginsengisoli]|uniref:Uncharacterized protein n=1 Tax=Nocardioides marmoriginsengisoli TaxID=661483 RepID=A0A3N0CH59_9ACTN|nr:hypothetical protein [Nocardioides marmoriginsengisoli]RNL62784.1 hypothetical protein EFK50_13640 [Nocardioides marmoriginsengisoli]
MLARSVEDYDLETCWLKYRAHAIAGLILAVPLSLGVEQTERGDEMFGAMARRAAEQVAAHDSYQAVIQLKV